MTTYTEEELLLFERQLTESEQAVIKSEEDMAEITDLLNNLETLYPETTEEGRAMIRDHAGKRMKRLQNQVDILRDNNTDCRTIIELSRRINARTEAAIHEMAEPIILFR
jgi:ElaB/YqjD/DUF883 family membrane-anchored ribosome-binding protein